MLIAPEIVLVLPVLLPLLLALVLVIFWKRNKIQHIIQLIGCLSYFAVTIVLLADVLREEHIATQLGGWKAPYGITFIADILTAAMLCTTGLVALATAIFSVKGMDSRRIKFGYYPLYYVMIASISGIFLTGDIFNMYVWIELMLITSFILLALGGRKNQLEGTIKYTMMNIFATFFLLIGIGFTYGITGTLNLASLAVLIPGIENQVLLYLIAIFFLTALGIKAAIFPLYFWLPASYPTSPGPVAAIFGGLLAKVGFYALLRLFTLSFKELQPQYQDILLIISGFTMLTAVLAAVAHQHFLKILSVHVVSQVGYLVMGLGLFSLASYAGAVFFLIHIIIVKTNMFLIAGLTKRVGGTYDVYEGGGQLKRHSFLAILFLINAFSLAGVPPLSGFWSKFFLIKSALDSGFYIIGAIGLITGLLTLISMTKIWKEVFWKQQQKEIKIEPLSQSEKIYFYSPIIMLTAVVLFISFRPDLMHDIADNAAKQIDNSRDYINAVLK